MANSSPGTTAQHPSPIASLSTVDAASTTAPSTPARRLIAAGVKRGSGPLVVEQLSPADLAAHRAASYVRRPAVVEQPTLPPLPTAPAARRRAIALREW